jgi:hypothetical protein
MLKPLYAPELNIDTIVPAEKTPVKIQRTAQIIRAVLAWQDGQQEPLADLVEDLMQADEARRLLAQRGYGRESQALPELAEATPALWW